MTSIKCQVKSSQTNTCPFCHSTVELSESLVQCARCNARHHSECWAHLGHCATCSSTQCKARKSDAEARKLVQRHHNEFKLLKDRGWKPPVEETVESLDDDITEDQKILLVTCVIGVGLVIAMACNDSILDFFAYWTNKILLAVSIICVLMIAISTQKSSKQ